MVLRFSLLDRVLRKLPSSKFRDKVLEGWNIFRPNAVMLISEKQPLKWGLFYSGLLQLNVVIHFWMIGEAFNFEVSVIDYFYIIPIQLVILMLPSINGIGLREASSIFCSALTVSERTKRLCLDLLILLCYWRWDLSAGLDL